MARRSALIGSPGRRDAAPSRFPRLRSSVLLKILAALVAALAVSSAFTTFFQSRLTTAAVAKQANRLATSQLRILKEAYAERERTVVRSLRNLAQVLKANRLVEPERRNELIAELARAQGNL